jgi:hypothetical protein
MEGVGAPRYVFGAGHTPVGGSTAGAVGAAPVGAFGEKGVRGVPAVGVGSGTGGGAVAVPIGRAREHARRAIASVASAGTIL